MESNTVGEVRSAKTIRHQTADDDCRSRFPADFWMSFVAVEKAATAKRRWMVCRCERAEPGSLYPERAFRIFRAFCGSALRV